VTSRTLFVTEFDLHRLRNLLRSTSLSAGTSDAELTDLRTALEQATPVKSADIPADIVTMNSTVRLKDLDSGAESIATVVFPHKLGEEDDLVSILSPLGSALLGFRAGDHIDVELPGAPRRFLIVEVVYQPEAGGERSIDFSS
jgi:regulator of nucleoside diphosphate kinase